MNIVFSPLYSLSAILLLLALPAVFHLIAFRRSTKFIHIMSSILIANFILAFVEEIAGLTHLFDAKFILIVSLSIVCLLGYGINKKQLFNNENIEGKNISTTSLLLALGVAFFIFCYQKNTFPPFTPDTFTTYLPWARTIVEQGTIPAFDESCGRYVVSYIPFLYTTIAFLFSFFGTYIDSIPAAIPILYSCFSVFLLTNWGEEYTDHNISYFIVLSVLISPLFITACTPVLQEAPLLFFATASFYFLFKYLKNNETIFLVLLCVSSALMALTKDSGLLISFMLFCIAIIGTKQKKGIYQILLLYPMIYIPSIIWAIRNFYYFNNPVYPSFSGIFKNSIYLNSPYLEFLSYTPFWYKPPIHIMFLVFLIGFPAFVFTFIYMLRNIKKHEVQYLIACFSLYIIVLYISGWALLTRYLIPFLGVFVLYAGIELSRFYNAIPLRTTKLKIKRETILKIFVILIFIMPLLIIPSGITYNVKKGDFKSIVNESYISCMHDPREPHIQSDFKSTLKVLEYLQSSQKEKNLIIFSGTFTVFSWYGDYTVLNPSTKPCSLTFLVLNYNINKEPFDFNRNSTYIYNNLKAIGVDYVYAAHHGSALAIFDKINEDTEHFTLVYDEGGHRLWKLS
jgi:hypothetical protein